MALHWALDTDRFHLLIQNTHDLHVLYHGILDPYLCGEDTAPLSPSKAKTRARLLVVP